MLFASAICPHCKTIVEVKTIEEASICENCGKPFVTQKAMNSYRTVCLENNFHISFFDNVTKNDIVGILSSFYSGSSGSADLFTNILDINKIVEHLLERKQYGKAALFIFGVNTGYRCGDIITLKVKDFYCDKTFKEVLFFADKSINKGNSIYLNEAVRTSIEFVIQQKKLSDNNYVFCSDGNHRAYISSFKYNNDGEVEDIITVGERFDENGNLRERAPMPVSSVTKWLKNVCSKLGIQGNYSSNSMRRTFAAFLNQEIMGNRNVMAATMALGLTDPRQIIKDITIDDSEIREKWLKLNLGLEPLRNYIDDL